MKKIDVPTDIDLSFVITKSSSHSSNYNPTNRKLILFISSMAIALILIILVLANLLFQNHKREEYVLREERKKDSINQNDKLRELARQNAQLRDSIIALKVAQFRTKENNLLINLKTENSNHYLYTEPAIKKTSSRNRVTDIDGNEYPVVKIGNQIWMKKNLKTTRFNDGNVIPLITNQTDWNNIKSPGYCWYYNDNQEYGVLYGALYNWYTVNTDKLCPVGWHVPTDNEWTTMTNFVGGEYGGKFAAAKLKSTGTTYDSNGLWSSTMSDDLGTNKTGFTALPGGFRAIEFFDASLAGYWWSSTDDITETIWIRKISHESKSVERDKRIKMAGLSIRCIQD